MGVADNAFEATDAAQQVEVQLARVLLLWLFLAVQHGLAACSEPLVLRAQSVARCTVCLQPEPPSFRELSRIQDRDSPKIRCFQFAQLFARTPSPRMCIRACSFGSVCWKTRGTVAFKSFR